MKKSDIERAGIISLGRDLKLKKKKTSLLEQKRSTTRIRLSGVGSIPGKKLTILKKNTSIQSVVDQKKKKIVICRLKTVENRKYSIALKQNASRIS